jgi:hypothetical protein
MLVSALRRSLAALSLLMAGLLDSSPARATALFPDAPTPTDYYDANVDPILNVTRNFKINPQHWEAWLAAQPRSTHIEDRRNEPPPAAASSSAAVQVAPLPIELGPQLQRELDSYLMRTIKDPAQRKKLEEIIAKRNKEKEKSGRESLQ